MFRNVIFIIILLKIITTQTSRVSQHLDNLPYHGKCEPITIQFCQQLKYNETMFPNLLNHAKQEDVGPEIYQFTPFIKANCSPDLKFFLCSVFAPICAPIIEAPIKPCRFLCESVRDSCANVMSHYDSPWPNYLECSQYPEYTGEEVLCAGDKKNASRIASRKPNSRPAKVDYNANLHRHPNKIQGAKDYGFVCPLQFEVPKSLDLEYSLKVGDKVVPNCGAPCKGMFFTQNEKTFARLWIGTWATLCTISCLFTVLTFLIDTDRFRYPERPIIFLSVCYLMVAAAYVIGWSFGEIVSCQGPFPVTVAGAQLPNISVITQGTKHEPCTILFMFVYFFSMASSIWWVVLTLTWFLAAGLKWGHEAIEANSQYFHLAAWAVPAIKTISILAMGKVDGKILILH